MKDGGFWVSRTFVNWLFIAVGLLLWYAAYLIRPDVASEAQAGKHALQLFSEILKDIGVVVFSLALVDILWNRFGGDPVQGEISALAKTTQNVLQIAQQANATGLSQIVVRVGN